MDTKLIALVVFCVIATFTVYQAYKLIYDTIKLRQYRKNLEKQYLFDLRVTLKVIEQLEYIKSYEYDTHVIESIEAYIKYNKNIYKSYSDALTTLQLQKI